MRIAALSSLPVLACCACSSLAIDPDRPQTFAVVPFAQARFVTVSPGRANSPEVAVLSGDPATGPSAMYIRLRKGVIPMHVHVSAYQLVVMQGSLKRWNDEQTEDSVPALGAGSYLFEPANQPHANSCVTDECLVYLVWSGRQSTRSVEQRKK